ncbi:hypothetical protein LWI28_022070 [Acer negundo]|uniref:Uncharacterized protein n=1 Tax=Acer negundo TaxID=4023 RepID=A0AAD5NM64_ACENE|nr:hypothetical protein LWI28_022070 [Acer negundo]
MKIDLAPDLRGRGSSLLQFVMVPRNRIWQELRSFLDLNISPVPSKWKGVCQIEIKFTAKNCNKNIIGDTDGHGVIRFMVGGD